MLGGIMLASYHYKQFKETFDADLARYSFDVINVYSIDRNLLSEFIEKLLEEISVIRSKIVENLLFQEKNEERKEKN